METSAKASINVEDAFFTLARDIKAKMEKKLVSVGEGESGGGSRCRKGILMGIKMLKVGVLEEKGRSKDSFVPTRWVVGLVWKKIIYS